MRRNAPRILLWVALLSAVAGAAFWSRARLPRPAYPTPIDLSDAVYPPLLSADSLEGAAVPVRVFRPGPRGAPAWSDYLAEILRGEGLPVALTHCPEAEDALPPGVRALVLPSGCGTLPLDGLEAFVRRGGTLVGVDPDPSAFSLFGARVVGAGQRFPRVGEMIPSMMLEPTEDAEVARWWTSPEGARVPLLLHRKLGEGVAWLWTADVARAVALTRQGDPAKANTSGLVPHPSPGDLFQESINPERYQRPVADLWTHDLASTLIANAVPIPVFWPFPTPIPSIAVMTGDQDSATDDLIRYQLERIEDAGGELTLFLTSVTRAGPNDPVDGVAGGNPDPEQLEIWRKMHHQFSVHPNANALSLDTATRTAVIRNARDTAQKRYDLVPRTIRNHFLFWWGYTDEARALANLGFLMDLNFLSVYPGHSGQGYLTGSGMPLPFVTLEGEILPVFQQATQIEDSLLVGDVSFGAKLDEATALNNASRVLREAPGYGTAVTLNFHPLYAAKASRLFNGLLEEIDRLHLPIFSAERWLDLVLRRYNGRIANVRVDPQAEGLTMLVSVRVPAGSLWLRFPDAAGGQRCLDVLENGRKLESHRIDTPEAYRGQLVSLPAGTHEVSARYAGS